MKVEGRPRQEPLERGRAVVVLRYITPSWAGCGRCPLRRSADGIAVGRLPRPIGQSGPQWMKPQLTPGLVHPQVSSGLHALFLYLVTLAVGWK